MKQTLKTRFGQKLKTVLQNTTELDPASYKSHLKSIHTRSVQATIAKQSRNKVIQEQPPPIDKSEKILPRKTRTTLSQLRSGYSTHLNSYLSRINPSINDNCPDCNNSNHTTAHLFNCPNKPTNLMTRSLWDEPITAATFLGLTTVPEEMDDGG